jgi:hypothetical protein
MINPYVISISFPWLIINFIYFYAPTIIRMHPSKSFMGGSVIDSILPILSIFVTAFRTIAQRGSFKPSFQQCLKKAHPQCARSCSRAYSSRSFWCMSSSYLRFSSSYLCFW